MEKSFAASYHVLQVIGDDSEEVAAKLLTLSPVAAKLLTSSPVASKGHDAALSPFDPSANLRSPKGLKQLIQITFLSSLDWVEKGLPLIFVSISLPTRHKKEKKGFSVFYTMLVEFALDYFVLSTTLTVSQCLGGGQHQFNFDYIGLALHCFNCLSVHHASATCPLKSPAKPVATIAPTLAIIASASIVIKDLLQSFEAAPPVLPSLVASPSSLKEICIVARSSPLSALATTTISVDSTTASIPNPHNIESVPDSQTPSCKRPRLVIDI